MELSYIEFKRKPVENFMGIGNIPFIFICEFGFITNQYGWNPNCRLLYVKLFMVYVKFPCMVIRKLGFIVMNMAENRNYPTTFNESLPRLILKKYEKVWPWC